MEENEDDRIVCLVSQGDWKTLLKEHSTNRFLPWIWPNEDDLKFIADSANLLGATCIVSVGCGSALLEWLLNKATGKWFGNNILGVAVKGVEVDESWWTCKYSKAFLPLEFTSGFATGGHVADRSHALLFCYFNNEPAFVDYMKYYTGNCLIGRQQCNLNGAFFIVIGPGPDRGTHTNPTPFQLPAPVHEDWILHSMRELHSGRDFTAVFCRTSFATTDNV